MSAGTCFSLAEHPTIVFLPHLSILCLFSLKLSILHINSVAPPCGTWFITHHWEIDREENLPSFRRESNPQPQELCSAGVCSTTVQQPLPYLTRIEARIRINLNWVQVWATEPECWSQDAAVAGLGPQKSGTVLRCLAKGRTLKSTETPKTFSQKTFLMLLNPSDPIERGLA